jgi:hypothetical protein
MGIISQVAKQLGLQANHSYPSDVKIKNVLGYTFTLPCTCMVGSLIRDQRQLYFIIIIIKVYSQHYPFIILLLIPPDMDGSCAFFQ